MGEGRPKECLLGPPRVKAHYPPFGKRPRIEWSAYAPLSRGDLLPQKLVDCHLVARLGVEGLHDHRAIERRRLSRDRSSFRLLLISLKNPLLRRPRCVLAAAGREATPGL